MRAKKLVIIPIVILSTLIVSGFTVFNTFNNEDLSLLIQSDVSEIKLDSIENLKIDIYIFNNSESSVKLVQPGDGSLVGWRTPIVKWSVINQTQNSHSFELSNVARCGNINSPSAKDVFILESGKSQKLNKNYRFPEIPKKIGTYRIQLSYLNLPKMKWEGLSFHGSKLHPEEKKMLKKIRKTAKVDLVSNELIIHVIE